MAKLDKVFDGDRGHINLDDYYEFKEKSDDEFKDFAIERVNEKLPDFTEGPYLETLSPGDFLEIKPTYDPFCLSGRKIDEYGTSR